MLRHLRITDLTPASGDTYYYNRQWCVEQGAHVHAQPVSLFDYRHMLGVDAPPSFDLIVCFGLCLNVFVGEDQLCSGRKNSTVVRQYRFLKISGSTTGAYGPSISDKGPVRGLPPGWY